jgi:hypothetical protein
MSRTTMTGRGWYPSNGEPKEILAPTEEIDKAQAGWVLNNPLGALVFLVVVALLVVAFISWWAWMIPIGWHIPPVSTPVSVWTVQP